MSELAKDRTATALQGATLYIDCYAGVAGDMMLGALLDLGVPEAVVREALGRLPMKGWELRVSRARRGGMMGTRVEVLEGEAAAHAPHENVHDSHAHAHHEHAPHEHSHHEHHHVHEHSHDVHAHEPHEHSHDDAHEHKHSHGTHEHSHDAHAHAHEHHAHEHTHHPHAHDHPHVHYAEIREKISNSGGRTFGGNLVQGAQAEVLSGQSIRIFGVWHNRRDPIAYDLTFKVGDEAVYKSANFPYKGNIAAIGEKTVTIRSGATIKRLDLAEFTALNWNYSAGRVAKRQAEWLD